MAYREPSQNVILVLDRAAARGLENVELFRTGLGDRQLVDELTQAWTVALDISAIEECLRALTNIDCGECLDLGWRVCEILDPNEVQNVFKVAARYPQLAACTCQVETDDEERVRPPLRLCPRRSAECVLCRGGGLVPRWVREAIIGGAGVAPREEALAKVSVTVEPALPAMLPSLCPRCAGAGLILVPNDALPTERESTRPRDEEPSKPASAEPTSPTGEPDALEIRGPDGVFRYRGLQGVVRNRRVGLRRLGRLLERPHHAIPLADLADRPAEEAVDPSRANPVLTEASVADLARKLEAADGAEGARELSLFSREGESLAAKKARDAVRNSIKRVFPDLRRAQMPDLVIHLDRRLHFDHGVGCYRPEPGETPPVVRFVD